MFDEEPEGDVHGECAHEIKTLRAENERLKKEVIRWETEAVTEYQRGFRNRSSIEHEGLEAKLEKAKVAMNKIDAETWYHDHASIIAALKRFQEIARECLKGLGEKHGTKKTNKISE